MTDPARGDTTDDAILNGRLRLLQPRRGHRFGHDAILLAAATPAQAGDRVAEFGAGVGAAGLALLARVGALDLTLIEIAPALTALARENIARNAFAGRAWAVTLDVRAAQPDFDRAGLPEGAFDCVLMNPPFNTRALQASPDPRRRAAHAADDDTLKTWLGAARRLLRPSGRLALIWRAEAIDDVAREIRGGFGSVKVLPVHPAPGKPAIRVLVNAERGAAFSLSTLPGLALADAHRRPSAEAEAVLRGAEPLRLSHATGSWRRVT
jgi:tRNA1(Val) A37 N6-methylase TrmN6